MYGVLSGMDCMEIDNTNERGYPIFTEQRGTFGPRTEVGLRTQMQIRRVQEMGLPSGPVVRRSMYRAFSCDTWVTLTVLDRQTTIIA
jgi:hypothetical protein